MSTDAPVSVFGSTEQVEALLSCKISLVAAGEAHSGAVDVSGASAQPTTIYLQFHGTQ